MSRAAAGFSTVAIFSLTLSGALVSCAAAPLEMRWLLEPSGVDAVVEVRGLTAADRAKLSDLVNRPDDAAEVLAVRVKSATVSSLPPVVGTYRLDDAGLRFEPRFPMTAGVRYSAVFHSTSGKTLESEFGLPALPADPTTVVEQIFPSGNLLPENQLKFYLHFSAPMSPGQAYGHVLLLDEIGEPIAIPFLELGEELWDRSGKRLTLFIDPGRIKRELKPLEEVGPVFSAGKRYTLVVDRRWEDARGQPLKQSFFKPFTVGPADRKALAPSTWKLETPRAGSHGALTVQFGEALDRALAEGLLWVAASNGKVVAGEVDVGPEEKSWRFLPQAPWAAGAYNLVAQTTLEDLAGNNVGRTFEVDIVREGEVRLRVETVSVPFDVQGARSEE